MAVEDQARLQPEGVAGPQSHGANPLVRQQPRPDGLGLGPGNQDLETVFAGVSRTGDGQRCALVPERGEGHEAQPPHARQDRLEHVGRLGPLQGDQRSVIGPDQVCVAVCGRLQPGEVALLRAGVDDDVELARLLGAADHQIVDDPAVVIEQQGVAELARPQTRDVAADQGLDDVGDGGVVGLGVTGRVVQLQARGTHVRDIEKARMGTGPAVLGQDPVAVLHRHAVAGEGHHPRAQLEMGGVKRCGLQGLGCAHLAFRTLEGRALTDRQRPRPRCPWA